MHSFSSGIMASLDGGNGEAAMLSGLVSSLISSGINALGTNFSGSKIAGKPVANGFGQNYMKATMLVAGGFSGGISSAIAGGKFIDGFRQGLITSGLNHVAHLATEFIQKESRQANIQGIKQNHPKLYKVLEMLPELLKANCTVLTTIAEDTGLTETRVLELLDIKSPEGQVIALARMKEYGLTGHLSKTWINLDLVERFETLQTQKYIQGTSFLFEENTSRLASG